MHRMRRPLVDRSHVFAHRAEAAIGLTIALSQMISTEDEQRLARGGTRTAHRAPRDGLAGKTIGIVGMGRLGQHIALRLAAFEVDVVYTDTERAPLTLESRLSVWYLAEPELWDSAEYVILTAAMAGFVARPLIDRKTLVQMRSNACIVNVAGNGLVDFDAISDALNRGLIGGYAADVAPAADMGGGPLRRPKLRAYFLAPRSGAARQSVRNRSPIHDQCRGVPDLRKYQV
jgi:phosphonate dehydrogenase